MPFFVLSSAQARIMKCWWSLLFLLHASWAGVDRQAVVRPDEFVAVLNSPESTTFTCTASPNPLTINFLVNGTQPTTADTRRGITTSRVKDTGFLAIEARAENNNTEVRCIVVASDPVESLRSINAAIFRVQGLLSPPDSLRIVNIASRPSYNMLVWQAPMSLNITNVEPNIIGYRVCHTFLPPPCTIVTETSYEILNIKYYMRYEVSAINVVGESTSSIFSIQSCFGGKNLCVFLLISSCVLLNSMKL